MARNVWNGESTWSLVCKNKSGILNCPSFSFGLLSLTRFSDGLCCLRGVVDGVLLLVLCLRSAGCWKYTVPESEQCA